MKIILILVTLLSMSSVLNQLLDFCSNNVSLHENEDECLKIFGCCYAILGLSNELVNDNNENIKINNCFKMYKENVLDTCADYVKLTNDYGNNVITCNCNKYTPGNI